MTRPEKRLKDLEAQLLRDQVEEETDERTEGMDESQVEAVSKALICKRYKEEKELTTAPELEAIKGDLGQKEYNERLEALKEEVGKEFGERHKNKDGESYE